MARLLCNIVLNSQRSISNDFSRKTIACLRFKYRAMPNQNGKYRIQCSNCSRSEQRNRYHKPQIDGYLLCAAPTFLAFFKKEESEDDLTWLEKLVPLNIRLMFRKEDDSPEGQLVMTMKRAIICIQREQYKKGEQIIHLALRMAQQMQHDDAITLCYDIMANTAMETEQYEKADKLFVAVLQRLLQKGVKQNDKKVLHISLKIAQIAEHQSQPEKAEQGYQWTVAELEEQVKNNTNDSDLYELWGLANDYYGKFLLQREDFAAARIRLNTSYDVYTQVHGKNDSHVVDMLNNLAVVCTNLDDFAAAEMYINEAIQLAKTYPEMFETGIYHANLGLLYLRKGLLPQARSSCSTARRMAKESNSADGIDQANYCIEQIKAMMG